MGYVVAATVDQTDSFSIFRAIPVDPIRFGLRKSFKMVEVHSGQLSDAKPRVQAYAARDTGTLIPQGGSQVNGGQKETDWTVLVMQVRDHQDKAAFAALFRHFAPRVKGFLMKSGASNALAEECAQDVMATLWQKAHLFDPTRASVATWVFTIARNRRIDALRKSRRPEPEELPWGPEPEPDQAEVMEMQQEHERLAVALLHLPEKQRALIEKAYYGDLTHSEIADQTGLPLGTIKSRIRLALDRLRHQMS
jgi:RNA polymerase sigma factor (sigma-70 family)